MASIKRSAHTRTNSISAPTIARNPLAFPLLRLPLLLLSCMQNSHLINISSLSAKNHRRIFQRRTVLQNERSERKNTEKETHERVSFATNKKEMERESPIFLL